MIQLFVQGSERQFKINYLPELSSKNLEDVGEHLQPNRRNAFLALISKSPKHDIKLLTTSLIDFKFRQYRIR